MLTRRMHRRLLRHHLPLALATTAASLAVYVVTPPPNPIHRWSLATGYVALVLLGATLAVGPLNLLRRRPNPVSTDWRRDLGIWAGLLSIVHFLVGWQVHMPHRYLYWLREVKGTGALVPRADLFGFANYTGLAAVLATGLLLALSNDRSLRTLGTRGWKRLQRWNYALFGLVVLHSIAYQVIESRKAPFVIGFALLTLATLMAQWLGFRRVRGTRRGAGAVVAREEAA